MFIKATVLIVANFVWGFMVPYMARRFAKFMPATPAYAFYRLIKPNKHVKNENLKYKLLKKKYRLRSLMFGLVLSVLSLVWIKSNATNMVIVGGTLFVWISLLLAEIDYRTFLLPDILTVPLLILGFVFSASVEKLWSGGIYVCGDFPTVGVVQSSIGALLGYFLPVIASLFMLKKSKDAFGGGDIKMLAAIGAWLGIKGLFFTILSSCVIFGFYMLARHQKSGAFGPALAVAAVAYMLYFVVQFASF